MLAPWVKEEMQTTDLRDQRLNRRLQEVLAQLAAHPTASIPAACGGGVAAGRGANHGLRDHAIHHVEPADPTNSWRSLLTRSADKPSDGNSASRTIHK